MALIGNGAQSEFQALAFQHLVGIEEVRLFDVDPAATAKLMRQPGRHRPATCVVCASTAEAVKGADIVTTVTADKTYATILTPDDDRAGHAHQRRRRRLPGQDRTARRRAAPAPRVFVEYEPQTRIEGDIQQMPADFAVTELWEVLAGPPRRAAATRGRSPCSTRSASRWRTTRRCASCTRPRIELGLGERIALIPALADPKNLFGVLR